MVPLDQKNFLLPANCISTHQWKFQWPTCLLGPLEVELYMSGSSKDERRQYMEGEGTQFVKETQGGSWEHGLPTA